jgi:hypothetical protein
MVLGLLIYFGYGSRNSRLRRSQDSAELGNVGARNGRNNPDFS